jgi:hypothetical protein
VDGLGGNADNTHRAWPADDWASERMGVVRLFFAFSGRGQVDVQPAVFNFR